LVGSLWSYPPWQVWCAITAQRLKDHSESAATVTGLGGSHIV
jgi:hypothetical protein